MEKIKSFIYLDYEKMYSLASQLFEGITDSITETRNQRTDVSENQKGSFFSGNSLSDIKSLETYRSESKYMHDYRYSQFEKELLDRKLVIDYCVDNDVLNSYPDLKLIKVTGRALIYDAIDIKKLTTEFLNLIEAITFLQLTEVSKQLESNYKSRIQLEKDKNKKSQVEREFKTEFKKTKDELISSLSGGITKDYLDNVNYMLDYTLRDLFEIQIVRDEMTFSSVLKREFIKEHSNTLLHKFSRSTECELVLFGIITQSSDYDSVRDKSIVKQSDTPNMKEAFHNILYSMIEIENKTFGKKNDQFVVDPIAVYMVV